MEQIFLNILFTSSIYGLIAFGFYCHFHVSKFYNFAHAAYITICAAALLVLLEQGVSLIPGLVITLLVGCIAFFFLELLIHVYVTKLRLSSTAVLVGSLGLYLILENSYSIAFGDSPLIRDFSEYGYFLDSASFVLSNIKFYSIAAAFTVMFGWVCFLKYTSQGNTLLTTLSNAKIAENFGFNTRLGKLTCILFSVFAYALSGVMIGLDGAIISSSGFNFYIFGIVVALIAGKTTGIGHVLVAAVLLASMQHFVGYFLGYRWVNWLTYCLLIFVLAFLPQGLFGIKSFAGKTN